MGALKKMTISRCVVCRDGVEYEISTTELVPGDLVKVEEGLKVPADMRVTESWQCKVDESALTGESVPTKLTSIRYLLRHCWPTEQICYTWVQLSQPDVLLGL